MNDFVLRGFCNECGFPVYLFEEKAYHSTTAKSPTSMALYGPCKAMKPVWFLSTKQIEIIADSMEYFKWMKENKIIMQEFIKNYTKSLAEFLTEEPFLVSKILKEAGEKKL